MASLSIFHDGRFNLIVAGRIIVDTLDATNVDIENVTITNLTATNLVAVNANITDLDAVDILTVNLNATLATITTGNITTINSTTGNITTVNSTTVDSTNIEGDNIDATLSLKIPEGPVLPIAPSTAHYIFGLNTASDQSLYVTDALTATWHRQGRFVKFLNSIVLAAVVLSPLGTDVVVHTSAVVPVVPGDVVMIIGDGVIGNFNPAFAGNMNAAGIGIGSAAFVFAAASYAYSVMNYTAIIGYSIQILNAADDSILAVAGLSVVTAPILNGFQTVMAFGSTGCLTIPPGVTGIKGRMVGRTDIDGTLLSIKIGTTGAAGLAAITAVAVATGGDFSGANWATALYAAVGYPEFGGSRLFITHFS
jgi:hypothetical protein